MGLILCRLCGHSMFRQSLGGMEIQLIHHLEFMKLDGLHRDVEKSGDLSGPSPFCNELQHFSLPDIWDVWHIDGHPPDSTLT